MSRGKESWHPQSLAERLPYLQCRRQVLRAVRAFFDAGDFTEVETPACKSRPGSSHT